MGVEHTKVDTSVDVSYVLDDLGSAALGCERDFDFAGLGDDVVLAPVLVAEGVSTNDDWLLPAWNTLGDVLDANRLSEHSAVKDVSDCAVRTLPHLLKVELLDSCLVWGDGGALDADLVLEGCICGIGSDLICRGIAIGHRQIVVLRLHVHVGMDVALLDPLPNDACHLIAVHVYDGVGNLHLAESSCKVSLSYESGKHSEINNFIYINN